MIHPILGSTAGRVLPRCWGVEWFPHFPRLQIDFVGQGASIVYFGGHRHNVDHAVSKASAHIPVGYQEVEEAIVGHDFGSAIHSFHEVGSLERIMAM